MSKIQNGIPVVAGSQRLQAPQDAAPWAKLKVANESPYDLSIQIAGTLHQLGPQTADLYNLYGANFIDVVAQLLVSAASAPSAELELTWAHQDEAIPGTYPMALSREMSGSTTTTFTNAQIGVVNAPNTKITSARPPKNLGSVIDNPNPNTAAFVLDSDAQALVFVLPFPVAQYVHLRVSWVVSGGQGNNWLPLELFQFTQNVYVVPILPQSRDTGNVLNNQVNVTLQGTALGGQLVDVWEVFESAPLWLQLFPQPQLEPNQPPGAILKTLAANVGQWLIAPVANIAISVFEIIELYTTNFGAADVIDVGHASALPASQAAATGKLIEMAPLGVTPFVYPYHGATLPRGDGIYVINSTSAAGNFGCAINYSLS